MAKAVKLPSGSWRVQAYHKGEKKSFTAETKREAEFLALEWQTSRKEELKPKNKTVRQAMEEYIAERSNVLSPTTIAGYRNIVRNYFSKIQLMKLDNVSRHDVQEEINAMSERLSPKTVNNAVFFLRASCGFDFPLSLPKKTEKVYRTPSLTGLRKIIEQVKGTEIEIPVLLGVWCGLRLSEIRGLRFDHVFPDHIVIDRCKVRAERQEIVKPPKNGIGRTVAIPRQLYDRIMEEQKNGSEYVTTLSGISIYKRFQRLTGGTCRFHDLRHANASVMMALGIPDNVAMSRGGWETEAIYKKTYAQIMPESEHESNKRINDFFINLWND